MLSRPRQYFYLITLLKKFLLTLKSKKPKSEIGKLAKFDFWDKFVLLRNLRSFFVTLSNCERVVSAIVRPIATRESVSKEKSKKKERKKKTGSTRKTTLIVGTHKSFFHVRLHTRKYESDIDHPV